MKMKGTIIFGLFQLFNNHTQAQQLKLDSLHTALKSAPDDTARMVTFKNLYSYYAESNRDSSMHFNDEVLNIAKKINQPLWVAGSLLAETEEGKGTLFTIKLPI